MIKSIIENSITTERGFMFALGIVLFLLSLAGFVMWIVGMGFANAPIIFFIGLIAWLLLGFIANRIFYSIRINDGKRGAVSVFYYLTIYQGFAFTMIIEGIVACFVFVVSFIISLFKGEFGGGSSTKKEKNSSEMKRDVSSFMQNRVQSVAPTSSERYQFDIREAYKHFCSDYGYDGHNKKLQEEFKKQYYKRVYS